MASAIPRAIAERKMAEQEFVRLRACLAARAAELEGTERDLEGVHYKVPQDLRRPPTLVTGYGQAIGALYGDRIPRECQDYLLGAYDGTLPDICRLARVEPRRGTVVDLSVLAHEVAGDLRLSDPGARQIFVSPLGLRPTASGLS